MFLRSPTTYHSRNEYFTAISALRKQMTSEQIELARKLFSIERFGDPRIASVDSIPPLYLILVHNASELEERTML